MTALRCAPGTKDELTALQCRYRILSQALTKISPQTKTRPAATNSSPPELLVTVENDRPSHFQIRQLTDLG
jgi:hypothetical protein